MKTLFSGYPARLVFSVLAVGIAVSAPSAADAAGRMGGGGGGGGGGGRAVQNRPAGERPQVNNVNADARTNNVRNTSVNNVNNVNVNRNVNVNVNNNGNYDHHGGWDNDYHPVATAAAVTATVAVTAAVVGSIVHTVPPNCVPVNYRGMVYQQCGSTWYQPQGPQYIVVNAPY